MKFRLEHANLCVRDINAQIRFLTTAFLEFKIRGEGVSSGRRWVHIGVDDSYIALNEARAGSTNTWRPYTGEPGVNHLAYEVDDVNALQKRMLAAGFRESTPANAHPFRKRIYFFDPEGNDWEFVQYFSEKQSERNDYAIKE